ncbi:MAG: glucose-methanol-choline oxidoreductase [Methanobacteriales archaeon Met13]
MIYDCIVVGTGAGGSTVARELSKKGLKIIMLEKGPSHRVGTFSNHIQSKKLSFNDGSGEGNQNYDFLNTPGELIYLEGVGGTTPVSLANACYACTSCYSKSATAQFEVHDLELFEELMDASKDLNVNSLPAEMMGPTTHKIWDAAGALDYFMEPMPKFIDFQKCNKCGLCINGCERGAKWDANQFVNEAINAKASLIINLEVVRVKDDQENLKVEAMGPNRNKKVFHAKKVILSAGALQTPHILKNSGIREGVGEGLFADLFITVGGYLKDCGLNTEIPMGVKSEFGPYFITPHYSAQLVPLVNDKGFDANPEDIVGLMVKIADQANGTVNDDGKINKPLRFEDLNLLKEGYEKCVKILTEIGVDPLSIVSTPIRGAHPGGTAAIGRVVDNNLETEIKNLYIVDASVIPQAPGRPPILTLTALAKRLAKNIIQDTSD